MKSALALLAALSIAAGADENPIRSQSTEVLLDLVVRDRKGRVVRDLKAEEIEILDDGKRVAAVGDGRRNRQHGHRAGRLREVKFTTLVFDAMNRDGANLSRQAALEFINRGTGPGRFAGVFEVREKLRVLAGYTNDKVELRRAIDAATGRVRAADVARIVEEQLRRSAQSVQQADEFLRGDLSSLAGPPGNGPPTDAQIQNVIERQRVRLSLNILRMSQTADMERIGRPTLAALRAAIEQLRALPGRKTVIYFTERFQIPPSLAAELQNLIAEANRANVSVYCIDATGLVVSERTREAAEKLQAAVNASMQTVTQGSDVAVTREQVMSADTAEVAVKTNNFTALADLAASTGGLLIADSNDLSGPMTKIAEEISTHYEITYAPEIDRYDGRFRPITIKVNRPKTRVQGRKGYFAMPPSAGMEVRPHEIPLLDAIERQTADLPFRAGLLRLGAANGKVRGSIVIEVPLSGLDLTEDAAAGVFRFRLAVLARFRNAAGEVAHKASLDTAQAGPLDRIAGARGTVFTWTGEFEIDPGDYTVDFAAMDRAGGNAGASRSMWKAEFDTLSDLALIRRVEAEGSPGLLTVDKSRVVPSLDTAVDAKTAAAIGVFFRVEASAAPKVDLAVRVDGIERARLELPAASAAFPYAASIPAAALPAGRYELIVTVRDGGRTVSRTLALAVDGIPPPAPASGSPAPAETVEAPSPLSIQAVASIAGLAAPPPSEQEAILASVRDRANNYLRTLPNFYCVQYTRRQHKPKAGGAFSPFDHFQELLSFVDGKERYQPIKAGPPAKEGGIASHGEWGGMMGAIFSPEAAAAFTWKEWATIEGERTHVFVFSVDAAHSQFNLGWGSRWKGRERPSMKPAYSGRVYLDAGTLRIRRLTLQVAVKPGEFPIEESTHEVDYDYQPVGSEQFLLPRRAVMQARIGRRNVIRNEIDFRDFRKWGAESVIKPAP